MITVNQQTYQIPGKPVVAICLDGTAPEYLEAARPVMPNLNWIREQGSSGLSQSVIPSFTNPNNMALVTGVPPAMNGISGNFYYDQENDDEVMMNDPSFLRCPTILSAFASAGKKVGVVTAKDKLRRLLGKDLEGICFSVEKAHEVTEKENGISNVVEKIGRDNPDVYDPECSVYCIEAGDWLLDNMRPDLLYLSTTDYVQHKYPPEAPEAKEFYARIDHFIGRIDEKDVILGITADHGMNDKTRKDGSPCVQFLESHLQENGIDNPRVILPITDPYVVHHGALGSFATVYLSGDQVEHATTLLNKVDGVEQILTRAKAVDQYQLPADRIGDLVVLADENTVFGRKPEWHDLSSVQDGLRSHGGLHEREVPFIINQSLDDEHATQLESGTTNNYELFEFLFNGVKNL
jgi:phosphonoacetate hydrolase